MDLDTILKELAYYRGSLPREALVAAAQQRERITPELVRILEHARGHYRELSEDSDYMAHIYAMYLLASFREKSAYVPIVELVSSLKLSQYDIFEDVITEDLHRILACVCDGDLSLVEQLVFSTEIDEYVRGSAQQVPIVLFVADLLERDAVVSFYERCFRDLRPEPHHVWGNLVCCCLDIAARDLIPQIDGVFNAGLVDTGFVGPGSVESELARSDEHILSKLRRNPHFSMIGDVCKELGWWACFNEDNAPEHISPVSTGVPVRTEPKVGRNAPCPCGSGKKYKKCCLR